MGSLPSLSPAKVWRLLTCHTFMAFSMGFVFNMVFLIKYGGSLETEVFRFNPAGGWFGGGTPAGGWGPGP
jgi:hypothetical protein